MIHHELVQILLEFDLHSLFSLCLGLILLYGVWMLLSQLLFQILDDFIFVEELALQQSELISQMLVFDSNLQVLVLCSFKQAHHALLVMRHPAIPLGICGIAWYLDVSGEVAVQVHLSRHLLERIETLHLI